MEAVSEGTLDAGLIIDEDQVAYESLGFSKVVDLGEWWLQETRLPGWREDNRQAVDAHTDTPVRQAAFHKPRGVLAVGGATRASRWLPRRSRHRMSDREPAGRVVFDVPPMASFISAVTARAVVVPRGAPAVAVEAAGSRPGPSSRGLRCSCRAAGSIPSGIGQSSRPAPEEGPRDCPPIKRSRGTTHPATSQSASLGAPRTASTAFRAQSVAPHDARLALHGAPAPMLRRCC